MPSVLINSQPYDVYADIAAADLYAAAASHAATWRALTDDDEKARLLVTGTRILDRQEWLGVKTLTAQPLEWPRDNVGVEGVTDGVTPQAIIDANIELAIALSDGSTVQDDQNQAQKIQALKAGSVALTFFRGADGIPLRFPLIVQELLKDLLVGGSLALKISSSGTEGCSVTVQDFGFSDPI